MNIQESLKVSSNVLIKNRLFKSAMSEQLGNAQQDPTKELVQLYRTWAAGGTGLLVTGNVMVDRTALGEPLNVVLDEKSDEGIFRQWAEAGSENGAQIWMQLNHPGKQVPNFLNKEPVAPSAVAMTGGLEKGFNCPRALTDDEITQIIQRFAWSAGKAKELGFGGVQIHGAHGYLVNQFLSPHHNRRTDRWGGDLEGRMKFLKEIYKEVRASVGDDYPVGIKLNSADFQKGGFTEEESMQVIEILQRDGIDLIEISGGNYENPSMVGADVKESTLKREAYFLDYAEKARKLMSVPLVVTGGFRSAKAMNEALRAGSTDMIGLGRPLAVDPSLPNKLLNDDGHKMELRDLSTGFAGLDAMLMLDITWYEQQLALIGAGKNARPNMSAWTSAFKTFAALGAHAFRSRRA